MVDVTGTSMDVHEAFTRWAIGQGIMIKGVKPHRFPQKGMGLMADTDLEVLCLLHEFLSSSILATNVV